MAGELASNLAQEIAALPTELKTQKAVEDILRLGKQCIAQGNLEYARICLDSLKKPHTPILVNPSKAIHELSAAIQTAEVLTPVTQTPEPQEQKVSSDFDARRTAVSQEARALTRLFLLDKKLVPTPDQVEAAKRSVAEYFDLRADLLAAGVSLLRFEEEYESRVGELQDIIGREEAAAPVVPAASLADHYSQIVQRLDQSVGKLSNQEILRTLEDVVRDVLLRLNDQEELEHVLVEIENLRRKLHGSDPIETQPSFLQKEVYQEAFQSLSDNIEKVITYFEEKEKKIEADIKALENLDPSAVSAAAQLIEAEIKLLGIELKKQEVPDSIDSTKRSGVLRKLNDLIHEWESLVDIYKRAPAASLEEERKVAAIQREYQQSTKQVRLAEFVEPQYHEIISKLNLDLFDASFIARNPELQQIHKHFADLRGKEVGGANPTEIIKNGFARIKLLVAERQQFERKIALAIRPELTSFLEEKYLNGLTTSLRAQEALVVAAWRANCMQVYPLLMDTSPTSFRGLLARLDNKNNPVFKEATAGGAQNLLDQLLIAEQAVKTEVFSNSDPDLATEIDGSHISGLLLDAYKADWHSRIEIVKGAVDHKENTSNTIGDLRRKIRTLEKTSPIEFSTESDELGHTIGAVYDLFHKIRDAGELSAEVLRDLEKDVLLFDYRYTKRAIDHRMSRNEDESSDSQFYFKENYAKVIVGWGFRRLEQVQYRLAELNQGGPEFKKLLDDIGAVEPGMTVDVVISPGQPPVKKELPPGDLLRFKKEIGARRLVFFSEQTLEPLIFGAGDVGANAQRNFPDQTPEVFIDQAMLGSLIKDVTNLTANVELLFPGEDGRKYNRELPSLVTQVKEVKFDTPGVLAEGEFKPTMRGEVMRLLDLLYGNRLHKVYRRAYEEKKADRKNGSGPYAGKTDSEFKVIDASENAFISRLDGFYRTMHISANKYDIPMVIQRASDMILDLPKGEAITSHEAKQTWIIHTLLCRQSELVPESSPALNDSIYKAQQWLAYLVQGSTDVRTTAASYWTSLVLFRTLNPQNPNDSFNILNLVGKIDPSELNKLPEAHNYAQQLGHWLAGVRTTRDGESVYVKMKRALIHLSHQKHSAQHVATAHGNQTEYDYMLEPLAVIPRNRYGSVMTIPSILGYMQIDDGDNLNPEVKPIKSGEKQVLRWKKVGAMTPPPVTAADYVGYFDRYTYAETVASGTPPIVKEAPVQLWENTPFDKILPGTWITDYFNNGANIKKLYALMTAASNDKLLDPQTLSVEQNDAKYAASFFPVLGPEVSNGRYDGKKVYNRITIKRVIGMCISLLASDAIDLHKLLVKIDDIAETIGQDPANAIKAIQDAGFGQSEAAQRDLAALNKQIQKALNFN